MPEEILPDVYDITVMEGEGRRFRVFLFDGPTPTLVDTGLEATTEALFDGLDEVGVEPERVVVTHGDGDHVGGLAAVVDRFAPDVFVPEQTADEALGGVDPDVRYGHRDTVGDFVTVHTPGHEPDNHALVDESRGVVVAGDALSGSDQRGLPAGYLLLPPAIYSENLNEAEASLTRLLKYEFDAVLVFHGSSVLDDAKTKLDAFVNFPGKPS